MDFANNLNIKWVNKKRVLVSILIFTPGLLVGALYWFAKQNKWLNEDFKVQQEIAYLGMAAAVLLIALMFFLLLEKNRHSGKLNEALQVQKEYLQITLNNIKEGLIATDKTGKIVYMNSAAESLTGWSKEEAANAPLQNVYDVYHDETGKTFESIASRIFNEGKEIAFDNNTVLKVKGGGTLKISNRATPILDEKGILSGAFFVFNEITKEKDNENKIKCSKQQFRDLIQRLPQAAYTCDTVGYIQLYNKAAVKLWGIEPNNGEELWNGACRAFGPDGSALTMEEYPMAIAVQQRRPIKGGELLIQRDDGSFRYILPSPVPMFNTKGELTGAVSAVIDITEKNDKPVKLIGIMVNITNKKISETEIKNKNIQLQLLSEHLQKIREEERASIAREIHDELGQQLTIMKMDISWLLANMKQEEVLVIKRAKELSNIIDQTVVTVRRIAYELRPSLLDDMGLGAAIEWQLIEFEKRSGIKTKFQNLEKELSLSDAAQTGLFRIVQESLTNVGRYSSAKNVLVSLAISENQILISIKDDGIGFELEKLAVKKTLGIVGMRERCILLGGVLEVISVVGAGTEVKVTMPIYIDDNKDI
jgi:PAS domain S-box-containing protein